MSNIRNLDALIAGRADTTQLTLTDANGEPINLAGAKIYYMSKHNKDDPDASAIIDVVQVMPDTEDTQNGRGWYTIPASQVPIELVDPDDIIPFYGIGYQLSSVLDRVEVMEGRQAIIKGVDDSPEWGA
ncbi:hypothetical protein KAR91_31350 [Candidatus Pacearchaeota archaeon]|nr:hypothetical protein [Candidatus Pacearchaeota archaeon]